MSDVCADQLAAEIAEDSVLLGGSQFLDEVEQREHLNIFLYYHHKFSVFNVCCEDGILVQICVPCKVFGNIKIMVTAI